MLDPRRTEPAVALRGADRQEVFLKRFGQRRGAPLVMVAPFRQSRLEEFAAQLVAGQPDGLEHRQNFNGIAGAFWPGPFGRRRGQRTVHKPQGGFAMITAGGAKLVEDARLVRPTGALIAAVNAG